MTVAVIGHGKTPVGQGWGPKIDACDIVVRMWDNQWQDEDDWGKKYTYGYFELSPKQWARFERGNVNFPDKGWLAGVLKATTAILPPRTKVVSMGRWVALGRALGGVGVTGKLKLTRGCAAAAWAIETLRKDVTLVGFDNVYAKAALTPEEGFSEVYRQASTTAAFKTYVGGGTKFGNHDYIAEGDILQSLAIRYGVEVKHAQDRWGPPMTLSTVDHLTEEERKKYELVWTYDGYRCQADGDPLVETAFKLMACAPGQSLIDWGCGKGTPAQQFQRLGLQITGFDIAHNCLDKGVDVPLVVGCLWDRDLPASLEADYSFCTDVLEHIPETRLEGAFNTISARTRKAAFIQVCCAPDQWGERINPPQVLHLTVREAEWWELALRRFWPTVRRVEVKGKFRAAFYCAT